MKRKKIFIAFLIIMVIIACGGIAAGFYDEYKSRYELCVEYSYVWPVDCRFPITFEEYKQSFSFAEAISSGYIEVLENILFSPFLYLLSLVICIILCANPFKKSVQNENISNRDDKIEIVRNKRKANPIKLILGMTPFILMIIHGIVAYNSGFVFLFNTVYGLDAFIETIIFDFFVFLPINIISLVLIIVYIKDLRKMKK